MNQSVEQQIYTIIGKHCDAGVGPILPTSTLTDLGIDSLGAIEIIFDIEEHFNLTLPDRDPNFDTGSVQGLITAVDAALAARVAGTEPAALMPSVAPSP